MAVGDFLGGSVTFEAHLPREAFDKILGNTEEEMDKMLAPGYAFDLSNGKDRAVTYISFPKGTKPEDVAPVAHAEWKPVGKSLATCSNCGNCVLRERTSGMFFYQSCGAIEDGTGGCTE